MFQQRGRLHTLIHTKKLYCQQKPNSYYSQQKIKGKLTKNKKWPIKTKLTTKVRADSGGARTGINIDKFRLKMANTLSVMTNVIRNVVSKQRIRYKEKGFNLDLAYICDNIIAMGYPADNIESIYRNPSERVYKFLEANHPDHYKIYNLCLERSYDVNKFHGRVAVFPFEDHNPPTIELIQRFCKDVDEWLKADSSNVAAVHCKAGKGRTGTMICCYLLYSEQLQTAEDALGWYDEKRTKDRKGVTIPSQRRYVQYFAKLIRSGIPYEKRTLQFCEIRFSEASLLHNHGTVHCSISMLEDTTSSIKVVLLQVFPIDFRKSYVLDLKNPSLCVAGDIKVELTHKTSRKKCFHFWINTYFVKDAAVIEGEGDDAKLVYTLCKSEIDDAHKDKEHKNFSENFKVQLVFYVDHTKRAGSQASASVGQISNERKSQNARLSQQSGGGGSSSSSNYQLPQNSSSGSDLNYICDQKSSSSASVSSLGGYSIAVGDEDMGYNTKWDITRYRQQNTHIACNNQYECTKNVSGYDERVEKMRLQQYPPRYSVPNNPTYTNMNCLEGDNILQKHQLKDNFLSHKQTSQQQLRHLAMTAVTSTPNHKQPQPAVALHKKLSEAHGASGYPVESTALGVASGKVQNQGIPANATTTAVNRASYSEVQSNDNTAGNSNNPVNKGSSSGHSSNEAVANGISSNSAMGCGSSRKSCSISSHSSSSAPSSAGDLDCEEDWESGEFFTKPVAHNELLLSSPLELSKTLATSTTTTPSTTTHSTIISVSVSHLPSTLCLNLNSNSVSDCFSCCDDDEKNVKYKQKNYLRERTSCVAGAGSGPTSGCKCGTGVDVKSGIPATTFSDTVHTSSSPILFRNSSWARKPLFNRKSFQSLSRTIATTNSTSATLDSTTQLGCSPSTGGGGLASSSRKKLKNKLKKKMNFSHKFNWVSSFRAHPAEFCENFVKQATAMRRNSTCSVSSRSRKLSTCTPPSSLHTQQVTFSSSPREQPTEDTVKQDLAAVYARNVDVGHHAKSSSASTSASNVSLLTGGGIDAYDFYSSICDNQLSVNNSPCKSARSLGDIVITDDGVFSTSLGNTPRTKGGLLPHATGVNTNNNRPAQPHNNGQLLNVVVIAAKPAKVHAIGFNVATEDINSESNVISHEIQNSTAANEITTNGCRNRKHSTIEESSSMRQLIIANVSNENDEANEIADGGGTTASSIYLTPPTIMMDEGIDDLKKSVQTPNSSIFVFPRMCNELTKMSNSSVTDTEEGALAQDVVDCSTITNLMLLDTQNVIEPTKEEQTAPATKFTEVKALANQEQ